VIPYFTQPEWHLGPFTVSLFQLLAFAAYILGYRICLNHALRNGIARGVAVRLLAFTTAGALIGAVFFKNVYVTSPAPGYAGISSFGGIGGGILGTCAAWSHRRHLHTFWNSLAFALAPALLIGRIGCVLAHDHPGVRGAGFLTVNYPGGPRYDLALIEVLFLACLSAFFYLNHNPDSRFAPLFLLLYGAFRILLDRLHENPPLWFGLPVDTVAGILSISLGAYWLIGKSSQQKAGSPPTRKSGLILKTKASSPTE